MPTMPVMKICTPPTTNTANQARPAGDRDALDERPDGDREPAQDRHHGHRQAEIGGELQRRLRMGENRLGGEAGELREGVARFAVLAGMMRQLEGGDGEAHEAEAPRKHPHLLPHLTEAVRDPVREDAEVADAPIELEAGEQVEGGVEDARRMPLDEAVALLAAAGSFLTLRRTPDEALPALSRAAVVAAGAAL